MASFLRNGMATVATLGLCWATAIIYWRQSGSTPSGIEMLTYLGVVPAGLLGGGWALRSMALRAADRALEGAADAVTADKKPAPAADDEHALAAAPVQQLTLLASSVRLPGELSPEGVLEQGTAVSRPGLHPRLKDQDGLPAFAAFVQDLPEPQALPENQFDMPPRVRRAIALLEPVLEELAVAVVEALPALPVQAGRVVAGLRRQEQTHVQRVLQVECMVDPEMPEAIRQHLNQWLERELQQIGVDRRRFGVEVLPVRDVAGVWERLQRVVNDEASPPGWYLLLGTYSALDPAVIERLQTQGRLYRGRQADGRVPGEAAAGLLFARRAGDAGSRLAAPLRVELPAQQAPHLHHRQSTQLAADALKMISLDSNALGYVISDASATAEHVAEAGQVAYAVCPELDITTQCLPLQVGTGHISLVAPLAMLALAHTRATRSNQAVLVLGLDAPDSRWVALLHSSPSSDTQVRPESAEAA